MESRIKEWILGVLDCEHDDRIGLCRLGAVSSGDDIHAAVLGRYLWVCASDFGAFRGVLVGCMEVIAHFIFTVEVVEIFGDLFHHMVGGGSELHPVYWLFFYIPALAIMLPGSKYFYPATVGVAVLSLVFALLYVVGTAPEADFKKYVMDIDNRFFPGGMETYLKILPLTSEVWLGIQSISLACEDTENATTVLPQAMISAVLVLFFLSYILMFSVTSHQPGIIKVEHADAPMNYGYAELFDIPEPAATFFSLVSVFGVAVAHMFAFSRQMMALSRSRLVSVYFKSTLSFSDAPIVSIMTITVGSYALLIMVWAGWKHEVHILLHASLVFVYIAYLILFASFVVFKISFPTMERKFTNPVGYLSVVYGSAVFLMAMVAILVFEEGHTESEEVCGAVSVMLFLYYYFIASKSQTYSKEEQHLLLKLYVIKGNAQKRKQKGKKGPKSNASRSQQSRSKSRGQQGNSLSRSSNVSSGDNNSESGSHLSDNEGSGHDSEASQLTPTQQPQSTPAAAAASAADGQQDPIVLCHNKVLPESAAAAVGAGEVAPLSLSGKMSAKLSAAATSVFQPFKPSFDASPEVHPEVRRASKKSKKASVDDGEVPSGMSGTVEISPAGAAIAVADSGPKDDELRPVE
mmetsp:Transcript_28876/g.48476  ORF Transcript_28876/g.48476 Transcript_28876/m.48476 type:complete len:633 (+) Transcript_28876:230-2128(+)